VFVGHYGPAFVAKRMDPTAKVGLGLWDYPYVTLAIEGDVGKKSDP